MHSDYKNKKSWLMVNKHVLVNACSLPPLNCVKCSVSRTHTCPKWFHCSYFRSDSCIKKNGIHKLPSSTQNNNNIVAAAAASTADDHIYDLYGVVHHYGNVNSGHYDAACCNPLDRKWYSNFHKLCYRRQPLTK